MGTEIEKRVAADGTQRGLHRKGSKNRRTELMDACREAVERDTGIKNWDPVVMLAVISARAFNGYPATDEEGRPVIDAETGKQVMVPPDYTLASAVAAKAAPYLHQHLKPKEVGDGDDEQKDPEDKRDEILARLEAMGVPVQRIAEGDAE
ncbi:MAG TPA: hypothetical protein VIG24_12925 [Acidimicrobiia bacterium]